MRGWACLRCHDTASSPSCTSLCVSEGKCFSIPLFAGALVAALINKSNSQFQRMLNFKLPEDFGRSQSSPSAMKRT